MIESRENLWIYATELADSLAMGFLFDFSAAFLYKTEKENIGKVCWETVKQVDVEVRSLCK